MRKKNLLLILCMNGGGCLAMPDENKKTHEYVQTNIWFCFFISFDLFLQHKPILSVLESSLWDVFTKIILQNKIRFEDKTI